MTLSTLSVSDAKILYRAEFGHDWPLNDKVVERLIHDFAAYDSIVLLAEMNKEMMRSYQGGQ